MLLEAVVSPLIEPFCMLGCTTAVHLVCAPPCVAPPALGSAYLQGHGQLFLCQHLIPAEHKGAFLPHHLQLAQEVPLLQDQLLLCFAFGTCEDSRAANPVWVAVEGGGGKWRRGNSVEWLIFQVTLDSCFITSLLKRSLPHPFPNRLWVPTHAAALPCVLSPSGCRLCRWCCQGMALQSHTCAGAASWPSAHRC